MTNEEIIDEMLHEAEELRVREYVLDMSKNLLEINKKMDRYEAVRLALENAKLHSGIKKTKHE
jgi:hypothetical protein